MKIKTVCTGTIFLATLYTTVALGGPHWTHEEQAHWGAIEDPSQTAVPLIYPYAVCDIGDHQSPVDLVAGGTNRKD